MLIEGQFTEPDGRQAAADDDYGLWIAPDGASNVLSTLGRGGVRDTARIDDVQVGGIAVAGWLQTEPFHVFSNLLRLVLVDFAAKGIYRKRLHRGHSVGRAVRFGKVACWREPLESVNSGFRDDWLPLDPGRAEQRAGRVGQIHQ